MGLVLLLGVIGAAILAFLAPQDALIAGMPAGSVIANSAYGFLAVALAASLIHRYRGRLGSGLRDALIWVALFVALVTGYAYRGEIAPIADRVMAELLPGHVTTPAPQVAEVIRQRDGHFVIEAKANGYALPFIFDTGATSVVLRAEDASKLGIDVDKLGYTSVVSTANGTARAAEITLQSLAIGSIVERNVRALVARRGAMQESLLGQTFLERLASYSVSDDRLALRGRRAQ
jgi:aspartyl protease family protein